MSKVEPLVKTPASRSTDAITSHLAEQEINKSGQRRTDQLKVLALVASNPAKTSREIASIGKLDRYTPSRRLPELEYGGYVERTDARKCSVGKRLATTWIITDSGIGALV